MIDKCIHMTAEMAARCPVCNPDGISRHGEFTLMEACEEEALYIHMDLHRALVAAAKREARNEARREAVERISAAEQGGRGEDMIVRDWAIEVILALMEETDDD